MIDCNHWRIQVVGSKFFHFHAVFAKKIAPTWELARPPQENPGSATGNSISFVVIYFNGVYGEVKRIFKGFYFSKIFYFLH